MKGNTLPQIIKCLLDKYYPLNSQTSLRLKEREQIHKNARLCFR